MKRILSFVLFICVGIALSAQQEDAYRSYFGDGVIPQGWSQSSFWAQYLDDPTQIDWYWEDGFVYSECTSGSANATFLLSPAFILSSQNAEDGGYISFFVESYSFEESVNSIAEVSISIVKDGEEVIDWPATYTISSTDEYVSEIKITFAQMAELAGLEATSHVYNFAIFHEGQEGADGALIVYRFIERHRSDAFIVFFAPDRGSGNVFYMISEPGGTLVAPECPFVAPSGEQFVRWSAYGSGQNYNVLAGGSVAGISEDMVMIAEYDDIYTLTASTNNASQGTILMPWGSSAFYGDTLIVVAQPSAHYHASWSGNGIVSTSADGDTVWVRMRGNQNVACTFVIDRNTVIVASNDFLQGFVSGGGQFDYGSSCTVSATAKEGFHFDHWSDGTILNPYTWNVTEDVELTAYFDRNTYMLSANANNAAWGTLFLQDGESAFYKDTLMVVARPAAHYHISGWSGDGIVATSANRDTVWVIMTDDRTVICSFAIDRHDVMVETDDMAHGNVTGGGRFDYGSSCVVEAVSYTGYHFDHWSDGVAENPYVFAVLGDMTLTAHFARNTYSVTAEANQDQWGTFVYPEGAMGLYQDTLMVVAHPAAHYHVNNWRGDGIVATSPSKDSVWVLLSANRNIVCEFAIDRHTVAVRPGDIAGGTVSGGGEYNYGTSCVVSATPYSGYMFHGWSNGSTDNPYSFAVVQDVELVAIFVEASTVTAVSADPTMGTATVNGASSAMVEGGTTVVLAASANAGYRFAHWNDGNTESIRTVTITQNVTFTAFFEMDNIPSSINDVMSADVRAYSQNGCIYVTLEDGAIEDFYVYDVKGRIVAHVVDHDHTGALPSGIYMVKVGSWPAKKVVVMR